MFRLVSLSSILIFSVAIGHEVQTADACSVKMGVRKGPKLKRSGASKNPSRILVVGSRDDKLISSLRRARHHMEYAPKVSDAKHSSYDLVIVSGSQMNAAKNRFAKSKILKKKDSVRSTQAVAETMLARSSAKRSNSSRPAKETGGDFRRPSQTGSEEGTARIASQREVETPRASSTTAVSAHRTAGVTRDFTKATRAVQVVTEPKPARWTRTFVFGTNKTTLSGDALRRLRTNAQWLRDHPNASLTIEGHTDSVGDEAYNLDLSKRRANSARDLMVSFGISSDRITVEGKGELEPAFMPSTSGRNRRIAMTKK